VRLVLIAACVGQACWIEKCDKDCDPLKEDCSLSPTCCTPPAPPTPVPPAPIALRCEDTAASGDHFFDMNLWIKDGQPPFRWTVDFDDSTSAQGTHQGLVFANGEARQRVDHEYTALPGPEPVVYTVRGTATDARNQSQTCTLTHLVDPQRLDIDCDVEPRSGVLPLTVTFDARTSGCIGNCGVVWDFGDGETATGRHAVHTYTTLSTNSFGTHPARGTVTDSQGRSQYCPRAVQVFPEGSPSPSPSPSASPTPTPTPSPGPNHPPVISSLTVVPAKFPAGTQAQLSATITDPDPGDTITWGLSIVAGSTATGTFVPAAGSGGTVSSSFQAPITSHGPAMLRLTAVDTQGANASATVNIFVFTP
jgi:hypothetical protein